MKRILIVLIVLFTLTFSACGMNPAEKLQEAASEKVAETLVEQATGLENLDVNTSDGSVSFSADDGEGGTIAVDVTENVDLSAITGLGFTIPLPAGLVNGTTQTTDKDGETMLISTTAEFDGLTFAQFIDAMHTSLTSQGFVYSGAPEQEAPDATATDFIPMVLYTHPDGYQFNMIGDDNGALISLLKAEAGTTMDGANGNTAVSLPTTLDGSMKLDNETYKTGAAVEVTLVINTPLADDAWVGIVPSETPHGLEADSDTVDTTYAYINSAQDGKIILYAPTTAGSYDVRLFNTDSATNGVELASTTITISE